MPKNTQKPWIKNHPLEGDGLLTGFYDHMWKKNKEFKSCEEVLCPDTIVYDHNFPRGWYTYDKKNKELVKKQGKELDTSSIYTAFSRSDGDVGIVASYMHSYEDPETGDPVTHVEFFNKEGLAEFVNRKTKKEGILQRFLVPKGRNNSVIQAVWSPRVCIVQRKTNVKPLQGSAESWKDPYSCAVTYEGPSHYSEDGTCAAKTTANIKQICHNIVEHFYNTEHKHITRMVLYFKVDKQNDVWLLWCGSVRVSDRQQPSKMPLNLSPIFTSPTSGGKGVERAVEEGLVELDKSHAKMSCDPMFFRSYVASPRSMSPNGRSLGRSEKGRAHDDGGDGGDDDMQDEIDRMIRSVDAEEQERNWYRLPTIEDKYRQLLIEREFVGQVISDVFYECYSHFLRHDTGPFFFDIDKKVAAILSPEALQEMMSHLRITHPPPPDDPATKFDEELSFWIANDANRGPITKLGEAANKWVQNFYDKKEQALREEAASIRKKGDDPTIEQGLYSEIANSGKKSEAEGEDEEQAKKKEEEEAKKKAEEEAREEEEAKQKAIEQADQDGKEKTEKEVGGEGEIPEEEEVKDEVEPAAS